MNGVVLIQSTHHKRYLGYFFLGLSSSAFWQLGVQIVLIELIALFGVIFLYVSSKRKQPPELHNRTLNMLIGFLALWIPTQVFVDLYNTAKIFETIKSIATIIALISLLVCSKYFFILQPINIEPFLLGYILSSLPSYFLFPNEYAKTMPWKFCFSMNCSMLFFWLARKYQLKKFFYLFLGCVLIFIDFLSDARSLAALTALALFFSLLGSQRKKGQLGISLILLFAAVFSSEVIYSQFATNGSFGEKAQLKAISQKNSGPILLVGRSELLYELQAIRENPIFGKGSKPIAGTETLNRVWNLESEIGINTKATAAYYEFGKTQYLPQHSMLFTAWLEGGLIAALPWLVILFLFVRWSLSASFQNSEMSYLVRFMSITGVWAVLFSPLGTGSRLLTVLALMLGFHCNQVKEFGKVNNAI